MLRSNRRSHPGFAASQATVLKSLCLRRYACGRALLLNQGNAVRYHNGISASHRLFGSDTHSFSCKAHHAGYEYQRPIGFLVVIRIVFLVRLITPDIQFTKVQACVVNEVYIGAQKPDFAAIVYRNFRIMNKRRISQCCLDSFDVSAWIASM